MRIALEREAIVANVFRVVFSLALRAQHDHVDQFAIGRVCRRLEDIVQHRGRHGLRRREVDVHRFQEVSQRLQLFG